MKGNCLQWTTQEKKIFLCVTGMTYKSLTVHITLNCHTVYTNDLLIVVKACVEPATLFEWANKRMKYHCTIDYQNTQQVLKSGIFLMN